VSGASTGRSWAAYRSVLSDPRSRAFCLAGFVARMPMAMTGLGIVLLISISTGSFGRAGLVTGLATIAGALSAPWWGRRMDRVGQAPVLLTAAVVNAIGLALLTASVLLGAPLWASCLCALVAGAGNTSAGGAVRARWTHRVHEPDLRNAAYALEAVIDEVVFIVGPVLVTFLATTLVPAVALGVVALLGLSGAVALAVQRTTEPPTHTSAAAGARAAPIALGFLLPIVAASAALGALLGGLELVVVAFARSAGMLPYTGVLLMVWAFGSMIAGLITGTISWRASPVRRFRIGALALAASVLPLLAVSSPVGAGALLMLSGLTVAPTLISSVALTQSSVPPVRLTEALGWTSSGLVAGAALGAAALGRVVDGWGPHGGFAALVIVALLLVVAALAVRGPRRRVTGGRGTPSTVPGPVAAQNPPP
jgi:predicted MFS family arabinose efflux permease